MSKKIKEQLDKIVQVIVNKAQPQRIILFGSYAGGFPKDGSDFDLFVIHTVSGRQIDRMRMIRNLLPRNREKGVDLIVYSPQEFRRAISAKDTFVSKILREGKELYVENKRSANMVQKRSR